ncbi:Wdr46, partial [Symbiodinium pilosum]
VIKLDDHGEVPIHSRREGLDRNKAGGDDARGRGKGRGRGGRGKGRGKGKNFKEPVPKPDKGLAKRMSKYAREDIALKDVVSKHDKKLSSQMKQRFRSDRDNAFRLAKAEVLQTAEAGFIETEEGDDSQTQRLTQQDIIQSAGVGVARKHFFFDLPYGPYCCSVGRNGQNMLAGGQKGHIAFMHL